MESEKKKIWYDRIDIIIQFKKIFFSVKMF